MSERIRNLYKQYLQSDEACPEYGLLYFDHLYSEYLTLRPHITEAEPRALLDSLGEKRTNSKLTWNNIYTFDLTLLDYLPPESLVRKAYSLRMRYRNVAGQLAYDAYLASKPPDLGTLLLEPFTSPPNNISEQELRADIRFLLGEFHLLYAVMPVRETLRAHLLKRTIFWLTPIILLGFLYLVTGTMLSMIGFTSAEELARHFQPTTLGVVAFVGVMGGFLSVLQRVQSAPSEGDAVYNLAAITHGTWSIYLSPFSGGIFAILLYVIFAAGIIQGTIIPRINQQISESTGATTTGDNTNAASAPTKPTTEQTPPPDANANTTQPTPNVIGSLSLKDFLRYTGPADSKNYALLVLWSFIAGFAERLVPDTLNRLVAKQEALRGVGS